VIELIEELPAGVVELRFSGEVTRDDYTRVALPALEALVKGDAKVRMLVVIDADFDKFGAGAIWEDLKFGLGSGLTHLLKWERTALVSDADWARQAITLFGWMVPGDIEVFPLAQLDEATSWLTR
jgi:stage II sporulation SpoAA-like protein